MIPLSYCYWRIALRRAMGMNQQQFAEAVGVSLISVGNWELGFGLKDDSMRKVAKAFAKAFAEDSL